MKTKDILNWVVKESINGEYLGLVDVPCKDEQTEDWWCEQFGFPPPAPIAQGQYLYFYYTQVNDNIKDQYGNIIEPDAEITIYNTGDMYDTDFVMLYKLED